MPSEQALMHGNGSLGEASGDGKEGGSNQEDEL